MLIYNYLKTKSFFKKEAALDVVWKRDWKEEIVEWCGCRSDERSIRKFSAVIHEFAVIYSNEASNGRNEKKRIDMKDF